MEHLMRIETSNKDFLGCSSDLYNLYESGTRPQLLNTQWESTLLTKIPLAVVVIYITELCLAQGHNYRALGGKKNWMLGNLKDKTIYYPWQEEKKTRSMIKVL